MTTLEILENLARNLNIRLQDARQTHERMFSFPDESTESFYNGRDRGYMSGLEEAIELVNLQIQNINDGEVST